MFKFITSVNICQFSARGAFIGSGIIVKPGLSVFANCDLTCLLETGANL